MPDLWDRLQAARTRLGALPADEPNPGGDLEEPAPKGWVWAAPGVAERRIVFTLEAGFWRSLADGLDGSRWQGVLCFDTETTGLSGGAGTVPFLIGWASLTDVNGADAPLVEVRQWFLRDLPGEPELIRLVDSAISQAAGLVSFNGASFDLPLLKSRWALVGRPFPEKPHRDDLYPARRLWRRLLGSCRLARIEETVLGLRRLDDVPGALVPSLWFDYLRRGAAADFVTPLEGVLRHHAQDVYSLLCLDLVLEAAVRNPAHDRWQGTFGGFPTRSLMVRPTIGGLLHPDLGARTPVDFWGLQSLQNPLQSEASLARAWAREPTEALGLAWAERLKRNRGSEARDVWTWLWETKKSYPALESLLKWLEHRDRSPEARAEAVTRVEEALRAPFLPQVWRESLEKRRARLTRSTVSEGQTARSFSKARRRCP